MKNPKVKSKPNKGYRNKSVKDNGRGTLRKEVATESTNVDNYGGNDLAWYSKNATLLKQVASFPIVEALGTMHQKPYALANASASDTIVDSSKLHATAGVMAINYYPAIGGSNLNVASAINVASRKLFATITSGNSRSVSYNAPAMMQYIISLTSLYSYVAFLYRLYGTARRYSARNKYLGSALVSAMGVDYDSVLARLNDLLAYANTLAVKLNQWHLPKDMSYVKRQVWMCENVYKDSPNADAQLYVFTPHGFFKYDESVTPAQNTFTALPSSASVSDLINYGNTLISAIQNSDDINLISADLMKYFKSDDAFFTPGQLPTDYVMEPVFNPEVLMEIENLSALKLFTEAGSLDVVEDAGGYLKQGIKAYLWGDDDDLLANLIIKKLNFHIPEVSHEDIAVATRLTSINRDEEGDPVVYCGTELVDSITIKCVYNGSVASYTIDTANTDKKKVQLVASIVGDFDWHPELLALDITYDLGTTTWTERDYFSIWDEGTIIEVESMDLKRLHDVCMLSLFDVTTPEVPNL